MFNLLKFNKPRPARAGALAPALLLLAAGLLAPGCGGGGGRLAMPVQLQVLPAQAALTAGQTLQFAARLHGEDGRHLRWSVLEADGGSVTLDGLYTAPGTAGRFHVQAAIPGSAAAQAEVRVCAAPEALGLHPDRVHLEAG